MIKFVQNFVPKHEGYILNVPRYFSDKTFDDFKTKFANKRQKLSPEERLKSMLEDKRQDNIQKYDFIKNI